jgi:hypothetical protein
MGHYKALNDYALITGINGFMGSYLAKKMFFYVLISMVCEDAGLGDYYLKKAKEIA